MFRGASGHTAQNLAVVGREDLSHFGGLNSIGADDYQVVFAHGDLRRGVPDRRGTGDLLVTVEVHVPSDPSEAERAAIEALAEATDGSLRDGLAD